ncbi:MAG: hypothetical protein RL112_1334 [Planctomycetota bacterium]
MALKKRPAVGLEPAPPSRFALPRRHSGVLDEAGRQRALAVAQAFVSAPTAPYAEDAPFELVLGLYAGRAGFDVLVDEHANLVVVWTGAEEPRSKSRVARRTLAFSAHLDHPGFLVEGRRGGRFVARFHGGVPAARLVGARVRFRRPGRPEPVATAVVDAVQPGMLCTLREVRGKLSKGCFGVFDLADGVVSGTRLSARVCDDLLGAAAIVCVLEMLAESGHPRRVAGIFTRAEETGFVGCIGLLQARGLLSEADVVGLECSPKRAAARLGRGPVVRVGDKRSVFDPAISLELAAAAESLALRAPAFRWQRALMDGGSCESTAYNLWGVRAGAACLALGNYHNCDERGGIGPEQVDWNDFEGLVALLHELAAARARGSDAAGALRTRLQAGFERDANLLARSAARILERLEE